MGVVLLVRHGQASFGSDDYDVLSEAGWTQGRLLGGWLRERALAPTAVIRGGMRRHRETAEAMAASSDWPEAAVDPGWDEFDHLSVVAAYPDVPEGELDRREFQRVFELATARWSGGGHDREYAEPWPAFRGRVRSAFRVAAGEAGPGGSVVVVSSGGPIAAVCADLVDPGADDATYARLWSRFNTVLVNSAVTRVVVGSTGARLLTFNEHPHLEAEHLTYR
ncbi:histidine phosphatase family protein [Nocardioides sp. YIM 152315]|uniref:histidine phosphatase family protein n=1 Tax=Nocardioides sp. YIM 152315 TaxID=3031760 RepID=UPI0023DCB38D|nr:histidine phosphatase family protein [Nocardioides sp. YIM 152315]MDF1604337.1 phosphoglycerate mutase family protein [Nocardioides sp. YIM 152315]